MIYSGRAVMLGALVLVAGAGLAQAGGDLSAEPFPQGPVEAGFADDRVEADGEAQFVAGDPFGRSDYWQEGRGGRRGTQFGPGFYRAGYYYPRQQYPDYWAYDAHREGGGSLWGVLYRGAIDPFVPDQREIDFVRALPVRVVRKLRIDEDLRRLRALADDDWAGGRYDRPRPLK